MRKKQQSLTFSFIKVSSAINNLHRISLCH